MRLTLVDNLLYESSYQVRQEDLQPHLGLASLAAVAGQDGHDVTIYDPKWDVFRNVLSLDESLYERFARNILKSSPEVVGFTGLGCNFHCVVQVARYLKRRMPGLPILLGGPHATILHREILSRFPEFDVVVRNEAERILNPLLAGIASRAFEGIPGVSYRNSRGDLTCNPGSPLIDDLDSLPRPAFDKYPLREIGLTSIRVEAGRGCPFSCTFCSTASFFGRTYRLKSTWRLLEEMDFLHHAYGYTDFKLNHDLFTVNRKKVVDFCEALKARSYTWSCSARVDCVDDLLLRVMRDAGCRNIYFGIETGSARMQEISRKRLDIELVAPTLNVTSALAIETTTSFITGYPEEQLDDQAQTLDMAAHLFCRPDGKNTSQIHLLTPEPGTDLNERYGSGLLFDAHVSEFNFPMLRPSDRALIAAHPTIFCNHHHYTTALSRERHVFVTTAWIALWEVGRQVTGYLLRAFNGRLSRFMDEAIAWWTQHASRAPCVTASDLLAFLEARFGRQHHIVSLFRYAHAVNRVGVTGRAPWPKVSIQAKCGQDARLRIGTSSIVLRDIHDCPALLRQITENVSDERLIDEAGDLVHLLIVAQPVAGGAAEEASVSTYYIDDVTLRLLERFKTPKSYWECCKEIDDSDGEKVFPAWKELASLVEMGALQDSNMPAGQQATRVP